MVPGLIAACFGAFRQVDLQGRGQFQAGPLQGGKVAQHQRSADLVNLGVGQGLDHDFRPDSHRVSHGQGQDGPDFGASS